MFKNVSHSKYAQNLCSQINYLMKFTLASMINKSITTEEYNMPVHPIQYLDTLLHMASLYEGDKVVNQQSTNQHPSLKGRR